MNKYILKNGKEVYYEYDEVQDMLYITFTSVVGNTYYEDYDELDGVMIRYDGETEEVVGITVHNVKQKMQRKFIEYICNHIITPQYHKFKAIEVIQK